MSDVAPAAVAPLAGPGEHLVAVVAQPGDVAARCGDLVGRATGAGARATVVVATRGEAVERRPDPATAGWPAGLLGEVELAEAVRARGVSAVEVLGHRDSGADGPVPEGALVARPQADVAGELAALLVVLGADVVVTHHGHDAHRDRVHLAAAVVDAVAALPLRPRLVRA